MHNDKLQQLFYENPISSETFKSHFRLVDAPTMTAEVMGALAKAKEASMPSITIDSIVDTTERA